MPNLATWKGYAKANNGDLVVWINQSEAPNLKAANSGFVCSAITRDWISSCRKYRSDRTAFVQSFRQYDDSGKLLGHSIPDHYLARQQEIKREIEGYTKRAEELRKKILVYVKEYPKEKDFRAALLESLKIYERIVRGGVDCIKFISETSIDKIMAALTTQITPAYFALSMKPADSDKGHVVGFEFRSDESTPSFRRSISSSTRISDCSSSGPNRHDGFRRKEDLGQVLPETLRPVLPAGVRRRFWRIWPQSC